MSAKELIPIRRDQQMQVDIDPSFIEARSELLAESSLCLTVEDDIQNSVAAEIQGRLAIMRRAVEKVRKALKDPLIKCGREIDAKAEEASSVILREETRIGRLCGDYLSLKAAKERALQAAARAAEDAERRKQEDLAKASSIEEHDRIRGEMLQAKLEAQKAKESAEVAAQSAPTPSGQKAREDWELTFTDLYALARAHPGCVRITPLEGEIKRCLDLGATLAGVTAKRITKSVVTARG